MIELEVQVDGDREVLARFATMTDRIRAALRAVLPVIGEDVKDAAESRAPHRKGKLRASIHARLRESGDTLVEVIRPSRFYGQFQETGLDTMRKPPRRRGIVGVRTRLTKSGGVQVTPRRGLLRRPGGASRPFHLPAHPFMRPAFESQQGRIVERIRTATATAAAEVA